MYICCPYRTSCVRWKIRTLFSNTNELWGSTDFGHKSSGVSPFSLGLLQVSCRQKMTLCVLFLTIWTGPPVTVEQTHFRMPLVCFSPMKEVPCHDVNWSRSAASSPCSLRKKKRVLIFVLIIFWWNHHFFALKSTSLVNKVGLLWVSLTLFALVLHTDKEWFMFRYIIFSSFQEEAVMPWR